MKNWKILLALLLVVCLLPLGSFAEGNELAAEPADELDAAVCCDVDDHDHDALSLEEGTAEIALFDAKLSPADDVLFDEGEDTFEKVLSDLVEWFRLHREDAPEVPAEIHERYTRLLRNQDDYTLTLEKAAACTHPTLYIGQTYTDYYWAFGSTHTVRVISVYYCTSCKVFVKQVETNTPGACSKTTYAGPHVSGKHRIIVSCTSCGNVFDDTYVTCPGPPCNGVWNSPAGGELGELEEAQVEIFAD